MHIRTEDPREALEAWKDHLREQGLELGENLRQVSVRLIAPGLWEGFMELIKEVK